MKKVLSIIMAAVMMAAFAGCGTSPADGTDNGKSGTSNETKAAAEEAESGLAPDYSSMTEAEQKALFYIREIDDELFARIKGKSFKEECTLPVEDLRYIHLLHKDLDGSIHEGEMICNKYIADDVCEIFEELYDADYPIERVRLIDEYDADDETAMEDNNSSSFNFRFISHTTRVSKHGLGLAVDLNTLYNPYIKMVDGELIIEPVTAKEYTDRSKTFSYKIDENDLAYKLFTEHGFEWGGSWEDRKDYQHFEMPNEVVERLYPSDSE